MVPALRDGRRQFVTTGSLEGTDVCFAPALTLDEAPSHPHNAAREIYVEVDGVVQAAPVPRFSCTPGAITLPPPVPGEHTEEILQQLGLTVR